MGSAQGMIAAARATLGLGESPDGSNHNYITTWYGMDGAWCDMSISYWASHSGNLPVMGGKFAYTVYHAQWFSAHGMWHSGSSGVKPGDVVFYDWGGSRTIGNIDHVELVETVISDGSFYTLGGNVSNHVKRTHRDSTYVVGYGRPKYTDGGPVGLQLGDQGQPVKDLQTALNKVEKAGLVVDGDFGSLTDAALRKFQNDNKLNVNGVYDAATQKAMALAINPPPPPTPIPVPTPPPTPTPNKPDVPIPSGKTVLKVGSTGNAVKQLQTALNELGYGLVVDGDFGSMTEVAVKKFQAKVKITADGEFGTQSSAALYKFLSS